MLTALEQKGAKRSRRRFAWAVSLGGVALVVLITGLFALQYWLPFDIRFGVGPDDHSAQVAMVAGTVAELSPPTESAVAGKATTEPPGSSANVMYVERGRVAYDFPESEGSATPRPHLEIRTAYAVAVPEPPKGPIDAGGPLPYNNTRVVAASLPILTSGEVSRVMKG